MGLYCLTAVRMVVEGGFITNVERVNMELKVKEIELQK